MTRHDIYVLHIAEQNGSATHYIGRTRRGRFRKRMKEHRKGKDTRTTIDARARGAKVEGFIIHTNCQESVEDDYLFSNDPGAHCPICNPAGPPEELAYRSEAQREQDNRSERAMTHLRQAEARALNAVTKLTPNLPHERKPLAEFATAIADLLATSTMAGNDAKDIKHALEVAADFLDYAKKINQPPN